MDESLDGSQDVSENSQRSTQQRKFCYRQLLNKVEGIQETEELGFETVTKVGEILREVNLLDEEWKIDERVGNADETLLDCLVLSSASSVLKKCIEAVDVFTSTYEPNEFANKIISEVAENTDEYDSAELLKLIEIARSIIPEVPDYNCVYGTYDLDKIPQPKPKKERVKVTKEKLEKKEPEKVTNLEKEEEGIEEIVKILHDVLTEEYAKNRDRPVYYYDYIIDTESFSNTVENMFYFAFLIRDGRAQVDLDSKGKPIIKPVKKKDLKAFRDQEGINAQIITSIDMNEWQKFKKPGFIQIHKNRNSSV